MSQITEAIQNLREKLGSLGKKGGGGGGDSEKSGGFDANAPAADRAYDAAAILGLAIAKAGKAESAAIRDAIRQVTGGDGEVIHAGPDQFRRALQLLREGKAIRYVGVIGPVAFDQTGDITGPFRKWRIQNGQVVTVGEMGIDEVNAVKAQLPR